MSLHVLLLLTLFKCCVLLSVVPIGTAKSHLRDFGLQEREYGSLGHNIDCNNLNDCEDTKGRIGYICASNGRTYRTLCAFMTAFCGESEIKFKHHGECNVAEKCRGSRAAAVKKSKTIAGVFIPSCNEDGTFNSVQCHNETTYCWCTTPAGVSIPGTALQNKTPDCENITRSSPSTNRSKKPNPKGGCEGSRKKAFNRNILQRTLQDFRRVDKDTLLVGKQELEAALKWQFQLHDKHPDGIWTRSEYRRIQKLVKGNILPKKCARKFPKLCDKNSDRKISINEWLNCFGDGTVINLTTRGKRQRNSFDHRTKKLKKGPLKPKRDCTWESKQGKESLKYSNHTVYIAKCDEKHSGRYQPIQCYGSQAKNLWYCFCVNVITGDMIPNTYVKNVQPDCPLIPKPWPRCLSSEAERIFLRSLLNHFTNIAKSYLSWEYRSDKLDGKYILGVLFKKLDKNKSGLLESKEKKKLKSLLRKHKKLWRCGRRIHKVCDLNYDGKIALQEFFMCILPRTNKPVKHNQVSHPGGIDRIRNRTNKGINGFIEIIKPE